MTNVVDPSSMPIRSVPHSCHWGAFSARVREGGVEIVPHRRDADPSALLGNIPASAAGQAIAAGNWSRAAAEARDSIRWAPWSADGWRRRGQAELRQNHLAAARRDLRTAIRKDPQNWDRWFDLALATRGVAQRRALEHALALNPHSPEIAEFVAGVGLKGIRAPSRGGG